MIMFYQPHIQLKRFLVICLLYLPLPVDAFTVISTFSRYDGRRAQCKYSQVKTHGYCTDSKPGKNVARKKELLHSVKVIQDPNPCRSLLLAAPDG